MSSVSSNSIQNSTINRPKIHRSRPVIARKVIAFQELIQLQHCQRSAREASSLLEVANSTMQSWQKQQSRHRVSKEMEAFFSSPAGADFLQRNIMAVMMLAKCGPSGIRGMQYYLRQTGLDRLVAASEGALQNFWRRCEESIAEFGVGQEKRLACEIKHRKITVGLDEIFRGKRPCLVGIEVVSNYILVEKFTDDRKAATWKKEIDERLQDLNVEVGQVVSDLCGSIRSCSEELGAEHSPDLFHAQREMSQATSAALASQERGGEKALQQAEIEFNRLKQKPRWLEKEKQKEQAHEIEEATKRCDSLKVEWEAKKKRRESVKKSIQEMGEAHHPIHLKTGQLQTAQEIQNRFNENLNQVQAQAREAKLSESSIARIEKAERAFGAIVHYLEYFFVVLTAFIDGLWLDREQEKFFKETVFPLSYLRMIWKRLPKQAQKKYGQLLENLAAKIREGPWPEELKGAWMKGGKEMAELFQRSSSCVEGRNGVLSFNHHRFHRLNPRSLQVLTIVHNFEVRRWDGTTAAERFFEAKHDNLFESLVANVQIPDRPRRQDKERAAA